MGLAGAQRARALLLRAILEHDVEAGGRALADALQHVGDDPALRARILLGTSSYHFYRDDFPASVTTARQALAAAEEDGDPALLATALAMVADRAELARHAEPALLERATALANVSGLLPGYPSLGEARGRRLLRVGDIDGARRSLEPELHAALRSGAAADRYRLRRDLAAVELYAGNWPRARRQVDDGWEFVDDGAGAWAEAEMLERQAHLAALSGDVDDARRVAAQGIACSEELHWPHLAAQNRWVLGFLELSRDEPEQAWNALEDVAQTAAWGRLEVLAAVADTAEALVALGRLEAANGLVTATLDDEARKGHRWAAAGAARCRALILTAQGDAARAVAEADRAAEGFAALGCRLDTGRARLAAGTALRRAGERRRAAEKLEAAKAIFSELGANLWTERAAKELRRASPRPRHDRELTPAERQVAAVVAAGRTNKEVAAQLYTTVATVEAHLTRIYRKLGIRSRTELARQVADGTLSLDD
ncbi:MAG TPA: LuxR C-terminal-related transcriptional regulator, partial [Gaiellaceae bacterium]